MTFSCAPWVIIALTLATRLGVLSMRLNASCFECQRRLPDLAGATP